MMRQWQMRDFFELFADRIAIGPSCWEWIGARISAGYGHGHRDGEHFYAHRAAYEAVNGEGSADGMMIRHSCDNPPCCRPDHLLAGTQTDNMADAWDRDRMHPVRGEANGRAVLTEDQVRIARGLARAGMTISSIARFFGAHRNTVDAAIK